jgi:hypothetical protein
MIGLDGNTINKNSNKNNVFGGDVKQTTKKQIRLKPKTVEDFLKGIRTKKPIKDSSIKQYLNKLKNLYMQIYNKVFTPDDLYLLRETKKIIDHVKQHNDKISTQLSYLIAITAILHRLDGYESEYKIYKEEMSKLYKLNKLK